MDSLWSFLATSSLNEYVEWCKFHRGGDRLDFYCHWQNS